MQMTNSRAYARVSALALLAAAGSAMAAPRMNERSLSVPGAQVATWDVTGADRGVSHSYSITIDGRAHEFNNVSYDLSLAYSSFDPAAATPAGPAELMTGGAGVYIVQFVTQPLEGYTKEIEALGGKIYQYMPEFAYAVRLDAGSLEAVAALPYVRAIQEFQPAYKIAGDLLLRDYGLDVGDGNRGHLEGFDVTERSGGPTPVTIMVFERGPGLKNTVAREIEALGGTITDAGPDGFLILATLDHDQMVKIARMPEVQFIEPWAPGGADMDIVRILGGANYVGGQTAPPNPPTGYNGEGVRGECADTEIRVTHLDLTSVLIHAGATVDAANLHGTATCGINFGRGIANPAGKGMIPAGQGYYIRSTAPAPNSMIDGSVYRYGVTAQLPTPPFNVVYQSNSTGAAQITTYSSISAQMDDILFINDVLHFQSQSNTGNQTSRPQAWAKNMTSVGGIVHNNNTNWNDDLWNGASIGYASDGRCKPDIASFYDSIFATWSTNDSAYTQFSGTSAATPICAGHGGVMMQLWHNGIFHNATGATVFDSRPKLATAKALIINTARQWTFATWTTGGAEPNLSRRRQGYGHPQLQNMYDLRDKMFIVNQADALQNLQSKDYRVRVVAGEPQFKATMAYADPQGNPGVQTQHRINNLDLKVTDPNGVVYWGNWGLANQNPAIGGSGAPSEGMFSLPGGVPNTKDTVENVFVQNPVAGVWTVTVIAAQLVQDQHPHGFGVAPSGPIDADFGLVVSGATAFNCPGDTNGDNVINFADLNNCLSNFGLTSGATTLQGDVDGDGDVDFGDLNIILSNFGNVC